MKSARLKAVLAVAAMCAICALQTIGMVAASAQPTDTMMDALLRPTGWRAEWEGPGGAGVTELVFQRQAEKVIAKIHLIVPFEMTCENPVTVGPGTVTFDGCRDPALTLVFNPTDQEIPFRGKTPRGYEWRLRVK
jgi:hypothetical protein